MGNRRRKYIIWDGYTQQDYFEDSTIHDCMVFQNSELVSVQKLRNDVLSQGCLPTIIFACQRGCSSNEIEINGKWHGVFTYHYTEVLGMPNLTFRDGIRRINELIKARGIYQICEIICREDVLDMEMNLDSIKGEKHCIMTFDMCRSSQ